MALIMFFLINFSHVFALKVISNGIFTYKSTIRELFLLLLLRAFLINVISTKRISRYLSNSCNCKVSMLGDLWPHLTMYSYGALNETTTMTTEIYFKLKCAT